MPNKIYIFARTDFGKHFQMNCTGMNVLERVFNRKLDILERKRTVFFNRMVFGSALRCGRSARCTERRAGLGFSSPRVCSNRKSKIVCFVKGICLLTLGTSCQASSGTAVVTYPPAVVNKEISSRLPVRCVTIGL